MTDDAREQPRPPRPRWATDEDTGPGWIVFEDGHMQPVPYVGELRGRYGVFPDSPRPAVPAEPLDTEALAKECATAVISDLAVDHRLDTDITRYEAAIRAVLEKRL